MKMKTIAGIMLLMLGMFCVASCGDDDEVENPDHAEVLCQGSWTGWTHLSTNFINKDYEGDSLTLSIAENGTLTGVYKNKTWGTATIKDITAKKVADGSFVLGGGSGTFVMNDIRTGGTQEFACQLDSATLSADMKSLEANISSYMETGHGNMLFVFHSGEKPAE